MWATAKKAYMRTLKVARIAMVGNLKAEEALLLRGRRKDGLAEWLDQATTFYTNLLHDAEKSDLLGRGTLSDAKMNLRRVLSFLTTAYSFALLHSMQAVWEVDPDVERLKPIEEMAKSDVQRWYDEQRDMRRFKFTFETTSNQQLLAMVSLR